MNNMVELRRELSTVFAELRSGAISTKQASELVNCAGKIISSVKVELEYYALIKETPHVPFLADTTDQIRLAGESL